jgi:hypothetical protein
MPAIINDTKRPTCGIPLDRNHEFLKEWLPKTDAALQTWSRWFKATGGQFVIRVESMTRRGHTAQYYMIYTHRVTLTSNGRETRWCCSEMTDG